MTGGLHYEINSGPIVTDTRYLPDFYKAVQTYVKENGGIEFILKPYDHYQVFDSNGNPTEEEQKTAFSNHYWILAINLMAYKWAILEESLFGII